MTQFGHTPDTLSAVDTSLSVSAGGSWVSGSSFDCKDGTNALICDYIAAQFSSTNSGTTDGQDLEVIAQFSDDNSNWPDDGEGQPVYAYADSTAGKDITLSDVREFAPTLRYARFQFANNNATDNVSVDSEVALMFMADDS